jgi:hypothetical protein
MSFSMRTAIAAAVMSVVAPMASATVLTFDDLSGYYFFTSNYMGFSFGNNNIATNDWYWDATVNPYQPAVTGTWLGTADYLGPTVLQEDSLPISNTTPFTFDGAYFSGGGNISYKLYSGNTLVYTSLPVALDSLSVAIGNVSPPKWIASGYNGQVTSVVVNGVKQYYAMDNFTFNTPVPEAQTYAMMLAGLALVGMAVRRRAA